MSRDMTKPTKWLCAQRRLRSAWAPRADARADLSLRWTHSHFACFVMSRLILGDVHSVYPSVINRYNRISHPAPDTTTERNTNNEDGIKWAATWQNQQSGCAPSEDSDQPGICPVWSESSLSAWRKLGTLATHRAHSEDSDQTGRIPGWSESSLGAQPHCWFFHVAAQIKIQHWDETKCVLNSKGQHWNAGATVIQQLGRGGPEADSSQMWQT